MDSEIVTALHPAALEIAVALLASSKPDLSSAGVDETALARFACGWVTSDEHAQVVVALTESAALRGRLIQMRRELLAAQRGVNEQADVLKRNSVLAKVMSEALKASFGVFSNWQESCQKAWSDVGISADEKRSIRTGLLGIAERLRTAGTPPYALTRSERRISSVIVQPGDNVAELSVTVEDDESLVAEAKFSHPYVDPKEISLYIVEPSGAWAWLGSSIANRSFWNLTTTGCAAMLDLPCGDLSSHWFVLGEGRWFGRRNTVSLYICDDLRHPNTSPHARLILSRAPMVSDGHFVIQFELPQAVRDAYADASLTLSVDLGSSAFVLGNWHIQDLPTSREVELVAPAPGLPDCSLDLHSSVSLCLRRG